MARPHVAPLGRRARSRDVRDLAALRFLVICAGAALAILSGALTTIPPSFVAVGALVVAVAVHPPLGAYLLLGLTPLLAGIERGALVPFVRPSEALLAAVAVALCARGAFEVMRGASWQPRLHRVEWALLATVCAGSVIPLLWMTARGRTIELDDLLYAAYLWKFGVLFVIVRAVVRDARQVGRCLWISMGVAVVVGGIAILQAANVSVVTAVLAPLYQAEQMGTERGTSTLSSSFAVADLMAFNFAIAATWALRGGRPRALLGGLAVVFALGAVASGQFSGVIGLAVVVVTTGLITGRLTATLLATVPVGAVAAVVLAPVIQGRLDQFESTVGVPASWVGRLNNLTEYFWPQIAADYNWLTGVRVAARVPAPETWRDWVYIESGHTWLVWSGGILFAAACVWFLIVALRTVTPLARRAGALGVAAAASLAALWVNVILMTLDIHLTLRGAGELNVALLALALTGARYVSRQEARPR